MELSINEALNKKKQHILSKWQLAAFSTYANHDLLMGKKQRSRFSDPIAFVIEESTKEIFEWLLKDGNQVDLFTPLEEICRLRAIQEIKPSEALHFIFDLKQIIREELTDENQTNYWAVELWDVDKRIDEIGWLAFDIYSDCRAKICELRINEIKRMVGRDAG